MSVNLSIKMVQSGGQTFSISTDLTATIEELKVQIASQAEVPEENIRLVCAGKIWQNVATVGSYEPRDGAIVHCLNNAPRAAPAASEQTLAPVNPMQAMLGAAPQQPASGGDPMAQMMAQSQQMMSQNPEMMQQLMDSPMMQQMMSDPEMIRSMMRMHPQLNELMEQRPEIARMLEDPEVMRQSMQMMRNPSLMREMQRNADRAIGQLDVMPGGHNALVRAHGDMVDPLMAALSGNGQDAPTSVADIDAYSRQAEGAPNTAPLANPWGPAAPAPATATQQTVTPGQQHVGASVSQTPAQAANPFGPMMEQMMSNPAMMQQSMQMANQMFGGQQGLAAGNDASQTPAAMTSPFGPMMQQMMSNPAMMQQSMQMAQQMFGNQGGGNPDFPAMFGGAPLAAPAPLLDSDSPTTSATPATGMDPLARARFASQLAQLAAMGFCNEAACLRALQQHQGRVDAAIDALLAGGEASA